MVESTTPKERVLLYGNLVVDQIVELPAFPKEDTCQRALSSRRCVGGNGANSSRVLAQLAGSRSRRISWVGTVPRRTEAETTFALEELRINNVDTELLEEAGGDALPSTYVWVSLDTATRTMVSTRRGTPELSLRHFEEVVQRAFRDAPQHGTPSWCHIECRQPPAATMALLQAWLRESGKHGGSGKLSLELEKFWDLAELLPLIRLCDHVVVDQSFAERQLEHTQLIKEQLEVEEDPPMKRAKTEAPEAHPASRFLRALGKVLGTPAKGPGPCIVCTWGKEGSFALETGASKLTHQPAILQQKAVDSVGAGDTFIASYLHARLSGASTQASLHCGAAVAGRKVGQVGFTNLRSALPDELR